jgi:hypothetical protein
VRASVTIRLSSRQGEPGAFLPKHCDGRGAQAADWVLVGWSVNPRKISGISRKSPRSPWAALWMVSLQAREMTAKSTFDVAPGRRCGHSAIGVGVARWTSRELPYLRRSTLRNGQSDLDEGVFAKDNRKSARPILGSEPLFGASTSEEKGQFQDLERLDAIAVAATRCFLDWGLAQWHRSRRHADSRSIYNCSHLQGGNRPLLGRRCSNENSAAGQDPGPGPNTAPQRELGVSSGISGS